MKPLINIILIILTVFLSIPLFSQGESISKEVFMLDNRVDLKKSINFVRVIRVISQQNVPSGLATPAYIFDAAKNEINFNSISRTKTAFLEINPKAIPRFFTIERIKNKERLDELFVDLNNPGIFMNHAGESIKPSPIVKNFRLSNTVTLKNINLPKADVAEEKTFLNSREGKVGLTAELDFKNVKLSISAIVDNSIENKKDVLYSVSILGNESFSLSIKDANSLSLPPGLVKEISKMFGQKIIDMAKQCNGSNEPFFCNKKLSNKEFSSKLLPFIREIPGLENANLRSCCNNSIFKEINK